MLAKQFNNLDDIKFLVEEQDKLEELLGIIAGDGYLSAGSYIIGISVNSTDIYLRKRVELLFKELFNIRPRIAKYKSKRCILMRVYSKKIYSYLAEYIPIGNKRGKQIDIPIPITWASLRGLILSDGYIYPHKVRKHCYWNIYFTNTNKALIDKVYHFLVSEDIQPIMRRDVRPSFGKRPKYQVIIYRKKDALRFLTKTKLWQKVLI